MRCPQNYGVEGGFPPLSLKSDTLPLHGPKAHPLLEARRLVYCGKSGKIEEICIDPPLNHVKYQTPPCGIRFYYIDPPRGPPPGHSRQAGPPPLAMTHAHVWMDASNF